MESSQKIDQPEDCEIDVEMIMKEFNLRNDKTLDLYQDSLELQEQSLSETKTKFRLAKNFEQQSTRRELIEQSIFKSKSELIDYYEYEENMSKSNDSLFKQDQEIISAEESELLRDFVRSQEQKFKDDPFNNEKIIPSDCYVKFDTAKFFKMLIYHLLYFQIAGPFVVVPLIMMVDGRKLLTNMGFWGFTRTHLSNLILATCMQLGLITFIVSEKSGTLNYVELFAAELTMLIKTFLTSIRYATHSKSRKYMYRNQYLTRHELIQDFVEQAWSELKPDIVDREIKNSMIINEIENLSFGCQFLSKMRDHFKDAICDYQYYEKNNYDTQKLQIVLRKTKEIFNHQSNQDLTFTSAVSSKLKTKKAIIFPQKQNATDEIENTVLIRNSIEEVDDQKLLTRYSARTFMREQFLTSQVLLPPRQKSLGIVLSIIHGLLSFSMVFSTDYKNETNEEIWYHRYIHTDFWVYTISLFYINSFIFYKNIVFMDVALIDFGRTYIVMQLMNVLLEPNRQKLNNITRNFPIINFFDKRSMLCWLDLKLLLENFGLRYRWTLIIFEILIMLILTILLFNYAERTNHIFQMQIHKLLELKNQLERIHSEWDFIMDSSNDLKENQLFQLTNLH
ncbi:UNKNOWN [Stylonychia lemnae]|uniref:Transmembrane protein n=1 Tax=Stylonychia lemnae TaxID=5949 RepID=A0A078AW45_STYLE|nr:UNKNOWN [Stylonychia lemnae]|eukprot:CDW86306.1 UNKNOWN [Stylonychia lemnae]